MPKISILHLDELPVSRARDRVGEIPGTMTPGELGSERVAIFPHDGETLELFQVSLPPDAEVRPHAHTAAEIIVVQEGELRFGARRAVAGSAVFIDAHVLYGFRAGPDGVRFLNFRGETDSRYVSRDEYRATAGHETDTRA